MLLFNLPRVCEHLTQHHREMHLSLKCIFQVNDTLIPWSPTAGGAGKEALATQRTKNILDFSRLWEGGLSANGGVEKVGGGL